MGAIAAAILRWRRRRFFDEHLASIGGGLIAGESLIGVLVAALLLAGVLSQ